MTMQARKSLASHCLYTMVLDCSLFLTQSLSTHNHDQTMKHILPLVLTTTLLFHPAEPRFLRWRNRNRRGLGDPRDLIRQAHAES
jgi:hypothetical protein